MTLHHFSLRARLQAMLDVEAALAEAEASLEVIPGSAARAIRDACDAELYDPDPIAADAQRDGNLAIPLVRALTERVARADADAAGYVHWGATSQDIIDTALVLQLRAAVPGIIGDLLRASAAAANLARRHATTVMAGRTWLQQATPITFGLKAAGWTDALDRVTAGTRAALTAAMVLQFGGASGTLAALGEHGVPVSRRLAAMLDLTVPSMPWHAQRDRLASLLCALGVATGTAGKIARDIALLAQSEVREAHVPADGGGSSTMPHKQNPVHAAIALAAAVRAPGLVATFLSGMPQEHERALGGWQAEWHTIPELVSVAGDAASAIAVCLERLAIDPQRMRANIDASGGLILAESVAMRLAPSLGRQAAHECVERAARRAVQEGRAFADVLAEDPKIAAILDRQAIDAALSPDAYLGSTSTFITAVLASHPNS
jgi:3-carboxy-cis,cis-muconate cycloisomerase